MIEETGGSHGVRDLGLLGSARPRAGFGEEDAYPDSFTKAAALAQSLAQNHPFVDGNKRTAVAAAGVFLELNGFRLGASNEELEELGMALARDDWSLKDIVRWLNERCDQEAS